MEFTLAACTSSCSGTCAAFDRDGDQPLPSAKTPQSEQERIPPHGFDSRSETRSDRTTPDAPSVHDTGPHLDFHERQMEPLKTMQLQFPGFHRPVDIRCTSGWTPPNPLDPLQTLGPVEDLLYWLDDFGLEAFSPVEAILVMNAWPAGATRQAAAALSDLLAESNSNFFFAATLAPRRAGTRARHTVVNVVVFFTYRGLNGVLQMEDTT